jgi:hypothetical protein
MLLDERLGLGACLGGGERLKNNIINMKKKKEPEKDITHNPGMWMNYELQ